MKPTSLFSKILSRFAFVFYLAAFLFIASCKSCCDCPKDCPCPPQPTPIVTPCDTCGPGNVAITISGTVKEQFGGSGQTGSSGATIRYNGTTFEGTYVTSSTGALGATGNTYDQINLPPANLSASKNGAIDEIVYNKIGPVSSSIDTRDQTYLLGPTGPTTPIYIVAQNLGRTPYQNASVQVKTLGGMLVGGALTTGMNGGCTGPMLNQNTNYIVSITANGGTPSIQYPFNTSIPTGTTGSLCNMRLFVRF